jgi:hypothetical protein
MNKSELAVRVEREHGAFEYIRYMQVSPIHLPEDAPQDVKSAWIRLYTQSIKDAELIERWLNE